MFIGVFGMRDGVELSMGWLGRSIVGWCRGGLFRVFGETFYLGRTIKSSGLLTIIYIISFYTIYQTYTLYNLSPPSKFPIKQTRNH